MFSITQAKIVEFIGVFLADTNIEICKHVRDLTCQQVKYSWQRHENITEQRQKRGSKTLNNHLLESLE